MGLLNYSGRDLQTIAGPLTDVVFDGRMVNEPEPDPNPMRDVELSGAVFVGVEFRAVTFDRVRLCVPMGGQRRAARMPGADGYLAALALTTEHRK
jgi:hypothetical protein